VDFLYFVVFNFVSVKLATSFNYSYLNFIAGVCNVYCLQFNVHLGQESQIDERSHGGQIVLSYWQHVTNMTRATVFRVYMSLTRVLVWVRGKAE
jgi:hypothetical protein